jgi:putative ABC transport system permease protein
LTILNSFWQKISGDLLQHKARSLLAISSIAAGVFCIGAIQGMIDLQLSAMDQAHRAAQPAHIGFFLRNPATKETINSITSLSDVAGIDVESQTTVRYKVTGNQSWQLATIVTRPEFRGQKYDLLRLEDGRWPGIDEIAVERLSSRFLSLHEGSKIELETQAGAKLFKITGIIRHPFVKPLRFGGQAHFFVNSGTAEQFGLSGNAYKHLLVTIKQPYSLDKARQTASAIRQVLSGQGIAVNATLLQDPDKHWGRPFFAGINRVLQFMAWAGLALASVLIFNTVSAHMTEQVHQIGIMKAIGASWRSIAALYLTEVLLLSCVALAAAVPAAVFMAHVASCWLLELFNIACPAIAYSPRALAYMLLGGILTPVIAALWPVARAARSSIRLALASYGLGSDFGSSRFDLLLERCAAKFLPTLYAVAIGNVFRKKARLLWTQGVLIIAGVMFLVTFALKTSVQQTLDNELARTRYDLRVGLLGEKDARSIADIIQSDGGVRNIEFWRRLPVDISTETAKPLAYRGSLGAQLLAIPAGSLSYRPYLESGRWFTAADAGQRVLAISADTAQLNGLKPGGSVEVSLANHTENWRIIGIYRWLAGANFVVEPIYAPLETVQELIGQKDKASFAVITGQNRDLAGEKAYTDAVINRFWDAGYAPDVYTTVARQAQREAASQQFRPVLGMLLGLSVMVMVIAGIGLSGALATSVLQRYREIGVLRAIGASNKAIFRMFILEGLLQGGIAWLISVPLATFISKPVADKMGKAMLGVRLDYRFDGWSIGYWLLLMIVITLAAAYWPAHKATQISVRAGLDR